MAVLGSNGNGNDESAKSLGNRLSKNRNFNVNATKNTKANELQNSGDVAKPKSSSEYNPLNRSTKKRNPSKNTRMKSFFNRGEGTGTSNDEETYSDEIQENDPGSELIEKTTNVFVRFLKKHPVVIFYIVLGLFLLVGMFIVIFSIVTVLHGDIDFGLGFEDQQKYYGDFFAFENTEIYILNETGTAPIGSRTVSLMDYVMGVVYADTNSLDLSGLTDKEIEHFYTAVILVKKAQILKKGNYNNKTKSISLKVTDFNYCDASYGCKLVSNNGEKFYVANSIEYNVGSVISSYQPMESNKLSILKIAYSNTISKVLTPDDVEEPLTEYKWMPPTLSTTIYASWISSAKKGNLYDKLIEEQLPGYKVYNLDDYAMQFESVFNSQYKYWWPIGGKELDSNGLYSGDPTSVNIKVEYGPSFATQTINKGITIAGDCGITKVVSIADGVVSAVGNSRNYGKYVVIDHDDNIRSLYGNLAEFVVSKGSKIKAGELIGTTGTIKDDFCGLYFEMHKNGVTVNPMDYISIDNPRTMQARYIVFVQGSNNQQTVCKTLLASGFGRTAVAGIMANVENESGFRLNNLSDGGTSNGLFQWHKGRLNNLQSYCGAEYLTSIKCQLDFFLYEITASPNAENGIYNYLMGIHSAYEMGYEFCMRFERPKGGATSAAIRGRLAENTYIHYVNNGCQ